MKASFDGIYVIWDKQEEFLESATCYNQIYLDFGLVEIEK